MKFFLFAFLFFFASCQSSIVPGEKGAKLKNLYAEYYMIGEAYFESKKYDKAAEYYQKATRLKSQRVGAYYKAARSYAFAGRWEESLAIYKKLLKADPQNRILLENIAYIDFKFGENDEAKKIYEKLLADIPDDKTILTNYIALLGEMKEYDAALENAALYVEKFGEDEKIDSVKKKIEELKSPPEPESAEEGANEESAAGSSAEENASEESAAQ